MNTVSAQPTYSNVVEAGTKSFKLSSYDSKNVPDMDEGYRLIKCLFRKTEESGKTSVCAIVPEITDAELGASLDLLQDHIIEYLEGIQDAVIKEAYLNGATHFTEDDISLVQVAKFLESRGSGRLTKEKVFAWFDEHLLEPLMLAIAGKMEIDTDDEESAVKLTSIVNVYRSKFGALSSGKTVYTKTEADKLLKALEVTDCLETTLAIRFKTRLEAMNTDNISDLFDL